MRILLLWAYLICPLFLTAQKFKFVNHSNQELILDYNLVVEQKDSQDFFFPDESGQLSIEIDKISYSSNIFINTNFQKIKLHRDDFNKEIIQIAGITQELNEIEIGFDKKGLQSFGASRGSKSPFQIERPTFLGIKLDSANNYLIRNITIPIKGKSIYVQSSYGNKFELTFYSADNEGNNLVKLIEDKITVDISDKGSHKIKIDLSGYDLLLYNIQNIIVCIKPISGNIIIRTAPIRKNKGVVGYFAYFKNGNLLLKEKNSDLVLKIILDLEILDND